MYVYIHVYNIILHPKSAVTRVSNFDRHTHVSNYQPVHLALQSPSNIMTKHLAHKKYSTCTQIS